MISVRSVRGGPGGCAAPDISRLAADDHVPSSHAPGSHQAARHVRIRARKSLRNLRRRRPEDEQGTVGGGADCARRANLPAFMRLAHETKVRFTIRNAASDELVDDFVLKHV